MLLRPLRLSFRGTCATNFINKTAPYVRHKSSSANLPADLILPDELDRIDSHRYCVSHVRRFDRENYLAALFIKDKLTRRAVFCLRAFNVELALVKDLTSDLQRAKLRFHFWSKLIDEIARKYKEGDINIVKEKAYYKQTPIAKELLDVFHLVDVKGDIEEQLRNLIGARISSKIIGDEPLETMGDLELYCLKSNASIYRLAHRLSTGLHNMFPENLYVTEVNDRISDELGLAHGISNVIRGIPHNATMRCCYIPKDLLSEHRLAREDFMIVDKVKERPKLDGARIAPVVKALSQRCQSLLDSVRADQRHLTAYFRDLYLPRVAIQSYLKRLRKCNYNVCDPRLGVRNGLLPLSMKLATVHHRLPVL